MQDGLSLSLCLELDCLSSDVALSFAVHALGYYIVINSCTYHVELQDQMK